jgi:O-antigen/teichoic acid export membrane protein
MALGFKLADLLQWPAQHPARAGALAGWLQQGASLGSAILLIPVVTGNLAPSEAGMWFVFQSLVGMIGFADLGFGFAIARQVAFTHGGGVGQGDRKDDFVALKQGQEGIAQLLQLTRRLYFILSMFGFLLAITIFEVLVNFGQMAAASTLDVRLCWYALTVAVVFTILAGGQAAFLNGLGQVYQTRLIAGVCVVLAAGGAAFAAWVGWGLAAMGTCFAAAAVVQFAGTTMLRRRAAPLLSVGSFERAPAGSLRSLAKAALPIGGVNAFGALIYSAQTPLLGFLLGPEKVAPFYLAQKIGLACNLAVLHTFSPHMPFFTQTVGRRDYSSALKMMKTVLARTAVLQIAVSLAFFFFSPLVASVLLQRGDYVTTGVLALLALDFCLAGLSVNWAWFVLASGKNPFVITTTITGLLTVAMTVILVPRMGIAGIPLGALIANLAANHWFNLLRGIQLLKFMKRKSQETHEVNKKRPCPEH